MVIVVLDILRNLSSKYRKNVTLTVPQTVLLGVRVTKTSGWFDAICLPNGAVSV